MEQEQLMRILEAILFAAGERVGPAVAKAVAEAARKTGVARI